MTTAANGGGAARLRFGKVFGLPIVIALATGIGLVAGLVGDGWFDLVAWVGLAIPVLAGVRPFIRPARGRAP